MANREPVGIVTLTKREHAKLISENQRFRLALEEIENPHGFWIKNLDKDYKLDHAVCVALESDPETYRRIARAALTESAK